MKFEIELSRENCTLSQFLAYVRHYVDKRGGKDLRSDLETAYIRRGDDLNFNITHDDGTREKSISRPYEAQTYYRHPNGATYNEIVEFSVDTRDGKGHGYYYLLNVEAPAEAAETPEKAAETETATNEQPATETAAEAEKTPAEWEQESDRVQAATMAALARVIVREEATPAEDQTPETAPEIEVEGAGVGVAGGAEQTTPENSPEIVASRNQKINKRGEKTMNATQNKEIRNATNRGRAALDFIMKELNAGGYIMHDTEYPHTALYNSKGDRIHRIPLATAQRVAAMREFDTLTRRREWGTTYYIGRMGSSGHFTDLENQEHCKHIADTLDDYAGGRVVRCPECGQLHTIDDDRPAYRCGNCEYTDDIDEFETQTLYDYFEDILDIEYRCDSNREYRSVQIMVTCGGPNIYIDTASRKVELYWWGDRADWPLDSDTVAAVDEWAEEYWNCL